MSPSRRHAYLILILTALIWGAATPVIKFTLGGLAALPFLTYRFGLSSLWSLLSAPFGGLKIGRSAKIWAEVILYGFLTSTLALGFLFLALERTTVLDTTVIGAIGPLVIVGAGALFLKEHVSRHEKIGISIAFLGTLIASAEPILRGGDGFQIQGNVLVYLYLFANAASAVLAKKLLRSGVSPAALTNISFIVGFVTILPLVFLREGASDFLTNIRNLEFTYHLGVIFMALLSGTLAYALWTRAQRTIEIGEAAVFSYLYPLFSAPLAVFWLGEKMTSPFIAGAVLVAFGVYLAEAKKSRLPKA